jgi:hypothetical protein
MRLWRSEVRAPGPRDRTAPRVVPVVRRLLLRACALVELQAILATAALTGDHELPARTEVGRRGRGRDPLAAGASAGTRWGKPPASPCRREGQVRGPSREGAARTSSPGG